MAFLSFCVVDLSMRTGCAHILCTEVSCLTCACISCSIVHLTRVWALALVSSGVERPWFVAFAGILSAGGLHCSSC